MTIEGFEDKVALLPDGWAVRFNGCIEGARWRRRGPADAHLALLQAGLRKPQPEAWEPTTFDKSLFE